jgi:hypothetical protein
MTRYSSGFETDITQELPCVGNFAAGRTTPSFQAEEEKSWKGQFVKREDGKNSKTAMILRHFFFISKILLPNQKLSATSVVPLVSISSRLWLAPALGSKRGPRGRRRLLLLRVMVSCPAGSNLAGCRDRTSRPPSPASCDGFWTTAYYQLATSSNPFLTVVAILFLTVIIGFFCGELGGS